MPRVQRSADAPTSGWHGRRQALVSAIRALPGVLAVVVMGYRSRRPLTKWCTEDVPVAAFAREMLRAYQVQMALQRATSDTVGALPEMTVVHETRIVVGLPVALSEPAFVAVLFDGDEGMVASDVTRALRDIVRGPQR